MAAAGESSGPQESSKTTRVAAGEVVRRPNESLPVFIPPGTHPLVADILRRSNSNEENNRRERFHRERVLRQEAEQIRRQEEAEERLYKLGMLPPMMPEALERIRRRIEAKSTSAAGEPKGGRRQKQNTRKSLRRRKTRKQKPRKK